MAEFIGEHMDRKNIAICVPTLGTVSTRWAIAYQDIVTPMNARVPRVIRQGDEVGVSRNLIVSEVLKMTPKPSHIFFLDDDVIPATKWVLMRLLTHNVDMVSGIYFLKGEYGEPLAFREPGYGTIPYDPRRGLVPVWGSGMGLTLIRTSVFERVRDGIDIGLDERGNPKWFYTSGDIPGEHQINEDLWFCAQARKVDIPTHVDMNPQAFGWHYDLSSHTAFPRCQWEEFVRTGTVNWEIADDGNSEYCLRNEDGIRE